MESLVTGAATNEWSAVLASVVTGTFGVIIWLLTRGTATRREQRARTADQTESERKARIDLWDSMKELYEQLQVRNDRQVSMIGSLETERSLLHERILKLERSVFDLTQQAEQCARDNAALQQRLDDFSRKVVP